MFRFLIFTLLLLFSLSSYSNEIQIKTRDADKECFVLLEKFKSSKNKIHLNILLDNLMTHTSHSNVSLNTIDKCVKETSLIITNNDSLKSSVYQLDYINAIVMFSKGDTSSFFKEIKKIKKHLLRENRMYEYVYINIQAGNFLSFHNATNYRIDFYKENLIVFKNNKSKELLESELQNYNSLGFVYENLNQIDSALKYYSIGQAVAKKNNVEVWYGLMSGNLGSIYIKLKEFEKAKELLELDFNVSIKYKMYESAINAMMLIVEINNNTRQTEKAIQALDSARYYVTKVDQSSKIFLESYNYKYYHAKASIFLGLHQYDSAKYYLEKSMNYITEVTRSYRKNEKRLLSNRYIFEDNINSINKLETQNKQTIYIAIISVLLFASSIIILFILSNFNKKIKIKNAELEESNSQKDKIFSIIAHDLKAPLNTLHSLLELYNMEAITANDFVKYKSDVNNSINQVTENLNNLLLWASRSMKSGVKVEKSDVNLATLINDIISQFSVVIKNKNLKLSLTNNFNDIIKVDRNMLFVVLTNLINNAIKFTPEYNSIKIEVNSINASSVQIDIIDEGIGIPQNKINDIFVLSANKSTMGTLGEKGTGLGLIICYDFIKLMNGTIEVESTLNVGSKFRITLPIN